MKKNGMFAALFAACVLVSSFAQSVVAAEPSFQPIEGPVHIIIKSEDGQSPPYVSRTLWLSSTVSDGEIRLEVSGNANDHVLVFGLPWRMFPMEGVGIGGSIRPLHNLLTAGDLFWMPDAMPRGNVLLFDSRGEGSRLKVFSIRRPVADREMVILAVLKKQGEAFQLVSAAPIMMYLPQ